MKVLIEKGAKRVFASAVDWPGLARSGRDEASALEALLAAAPRYARVLARTRLGFRTPARDSDVHAVEHATGNATTDFGAPGVPARADARAMSDADLERTRAILTAMWRAFDATVDGARGKTLRTGPRGGGRSLDAIVRHVREAEVGYLSGLGRPFKGEARGDDEVRRAVLDGLRASAHGEIAPKGPRGGVRWKPRFFARRLAWHAFDHLLEVEERSSGP
jgi:hypothetical protein